MHILNVGYSSTNYYVLADTKARLLVDVGFAGTLPKLQHELKRMDLPLKTVPYLLATHFHPDHAGLARELQAMGIKLVVVDLQIVALDAVKDNPELAKQYVSFDRQQAVLTTIGSSRAFLKTIGLQAALIHTPGHSDDSVSLLLDDGTAFTGDLPRPLPMADGSMAVVQASWNRLIQHGAKVSYPGHGPLVKLT